MERESSTDKEDDMEDDKQALLNLERNIENIERSMSASQLEQANYPGKKTGVRGRIDHYLCYKNCFSFLEGV